MAISNTDAVKAIYQAFGEGRIADILSQVAPDVIWVQPGNGVVPWAGTWLGPDRVNAFFVRLAEMAQVDKFEPRGFVEGGDTVVATGHWDGRSKASGKPFSGDWAMVWKFRDGKVYFYQAYLDTADIGKAFS